MFGSLGNLPSLGTFPNLQNPFQSGLGSSPFGGIGGSTSTGLSSIFGGIGGGSSILPGGCYPQPFPPMPGLPLPGNNQGSQCQTIKQVFSMMMQIIKVLFQAVARPQQPQNPFPFPFPTTNV